MTKRLIYSCLAIILSFTISCSGDTEKTTNSAVDNKNVTEKKTVASEEIVVQELRLQLTKEAYHKIAEKRKAAIERGLLMTESDDWAPATLIDQDGKEMLAEVRLKGDYTDHLRGNKWSFRVKIKNDSWNGMKEFSLQSPQTRAFLDEWFWHEWLLKEDVLTTRYGFTRFKINGSDRGVYAYEEHCAKQLPESQNRREGPIFKLDDKAFWEQAEYDEASKNPPLTSAGAFNVQAAASAVPFKQKKTLKSNTLSEQLSQAVILIRQYRNAEKPPSEIFSIEPLAKYLALTDITSAYHSTVWHNFRLYFEPISQRLEPIAYDGFVPNRVQKLKRRSLMGQGRNLQNARDHHTAHFIDNLFLDKKLRERYHFYLNKYTSPEYLEDLLVEFGTELSNYNELVSSEFKDKEYDVKRLKQRAKLIQGLLRVYKGNSIKAYQNSSHPSGASDLTIYNFHTLPLEIIGSGVGPDRIDIYEAEGLTIYPYHSWTPYDATKMTAKGEAKYLFFQLTGLDSIYHTKIHPWADDPKETIRQGIMKGESIDASVLIKEKGAYYFPSGKSSITEPLIIPKDAAVYIPAGARIDFTKGAYFLSESPVFISGSPDQVVHIYSSDKSAKGFTIMNTSVSSEFKNVLFEDFAALEEGAWKLTGAVCFYKADVEMDHAQFRNNHCEDNLNLIRSQFKMNNCRFVNSYADGFDGDFCNGSIRNSSFEQTNNDALDFSCSSIGISNCEIIEAGDKGLSAGEASNITIKNSTISGCSTGVSSKDRSLLNMEEMEIYRCGTGVQALRKKPEFGPAQVKAKALTLKEIARTYDIEAGSYFESSDTTIGKKP